MGAVLLDYLATGDLAGKRPLDRGAEILEATSSAVNR